MGIYAISDLHLALSVHKPMDIFGGRWSNYMEKIQDGWGNTVREEDTVIIPGDISWATYLEQAYEDFKFIEALPGKKIISKGNHDYWWTTQNKLEVFCTQKGFSSISFMKNNSMMVEKKAISGTRGWKCPDDDDFTEEDLKIYKRELMRLELSLKSAEAMKDSTGLITALHYPPFNSKGQPTQFVEIMKAYHVGVCIYGHLHGDGIRNAFEGEYEGMIFRLVSADHLYFTPIQL